jgi:hypothetical protein
MADARSSWRLPNSLRPDPSMRQLMGNKKMYFRIICLVFHLTKGVRSQKKRALGRRQPRGRASLLTITQVEFLRMVIEDRFGQKSLITYFELLDELKMKIGIVVLTDTLRHMV